MNLRFVKALARRHLFVFDPVLLLALTVILVLSCITMYSAAHDFDGRFQGHLRNIGVSVALMWFIANLPPGTMQRSAVPLYLVGILLLIGVALFGDISKGARRWLDLKFTRIQPSELLKIAMPLMLAWFFHTRQGVLIWSHHVAALLMLAVPVGLIARQPDLGTAILVMAAGTYVIFFAGLSWRVIIATIVAACAGAPVLWTFLHDYQRQRILTLIDPSSDPLGKGFHIIQSEIAVGSGGMFGKGWMEGTQTHLEFVPERTTDFIFAGFAEEFGLFGAAILICAYLLLIGRGLTIASRAPTLFTRLMAGSISMIFFTYAFVNMGMVTGILPVVGVPLPMMSYGGTAMVTLGLGMGILMSIARLESRLRAAG